MGHFFRKRMNSVQFSRVWLFVTPWTTARQASCPSLTLGAYSKSCPSCQWCHPTISSSVVPSPPAFNLSQPQGLFQGVSSSHQVAKVLELQYQGWFPLGWTGVISLLSKGLSRVFSSPLMYVVSNDSVLRPSLLEVQSVWLFCSSVASVRGGRKIAGNAKN